MKRGAIFLVSQGAATERSEDAADREGVVLRPVVLVSREAINRNSAAVVVCPLVDAALLPRVYPSDVLVHAPEGGLTSDSVVLTGQLRAVPRSRLVRHLGGLSEEIMRRVDLALRVTLDLE